MIQVLLEIEQVKALQQDFMITVVQQLREDLHLNYWEELLDSKGVSKDWGMNYKLVRDCVNRKKNPLPMKAGRITRKDARVWLETYYDNYESKNS